MTDRQWAALPAVLDVDQLVPLLGISDQGVWARMRRGTIPAYRIAKYHIVFRDELRAHLDGANDRVNVLEGYPDILDAAHALTTPARIDTSVPSPLTATWARTCRTSSMRRTFPPAACDTT